MKRKGVFLGLLVLCMTSLVCTPVSAFRVQENLSWDCGLKYQILVENVDAWSTGQEYEIFVTLTLLEIGIVLGFESVTCAIYLLTEDVQVSIQTINNHWSEIGDVVRFTSRFTLTPEQVNNSVWDIYQALIFYQVNMSVLLDGNREQNCYMDPRGPMHVGVSTLSFWTLWPYPPIFLMMGIYFGGFFGLRKFNKRYEWFEDKRKKRPVVEIEEEPQPSSSEGYDSNYD